MSKSKATKPKRVVAPDYQLGKRYEIAPFGRSDIVKESVQMATFVGYLQKRWGCPTYTTIKWPVFEAPFYGRTILYALDNGQCAARGETVEALMDDFGKMHAFWGIKHDTIDVDYGKMRIPKADFITQMTLLGFDASQLSEDMNWGRYHLRHVKGEEIKWCPSCNAMRQTTCCACGCGNCKTCDKRWVCGMDTPVSIVFAPSKVSPFVMAPSVYKPDLHLGSNRQH